MANPLNENRQGEQIIADKSALLVKSGVTEHTIRVDPDNEALVMKVSVRDLSFIDMQKAIKSFVSIEMDGGVEIDLAGYWRYMMEKCVVSSEPSLSVVEMLGLSQFAGQQLTAVLPQPQDLLAGPLDDGSNE